MIRCLDDPLKVVHSVARLERMAEDAGIFVFVKSDFHEFVEIRDFVRPDESVSAMFDPVSTPDLSNGTRAFWVHGVDRQGQTVSLQAARIDAVDSNLAQWAMLWMSGLYRMRGDSVEPARWQALAHSAAERISGDVVYHGEFWLSSDLRGSDNSNMLDVLPRMALLLIFLKWQPDHVWGLVTEKLGQRGVPFRMGYSVQQPALLSWQSAPDGASNEETFAWCSAEDLAYLAEFESTRA